MQLLEPFEVRGITLPNRIVYPPCDTSYPTWQGQVTDLLVESYRYKARNCGLCIVEACCIEPTGKAIPREGLISDDTCIPGIARLAEAIHREGAVAGLQIHHAGMCSFFSGDAKVWGPSRVQYPSWIPSVDMIEVCSRERIQEMVQHYVDAAVRVKKAGFDLVEIHGAHGYLITQFLNGRINQRTDEYGGSLENRMRFPLEIARRVRAAIGPEVLLSYRYNGQDWPDSPMDPVGTDGNGWTVEDAKVFGRRLDQEGVDLLHISAGNYDCIQWEVQPADFPQGCLIDLAEAVKSVVSIPVIGVGRIWDPRYAEQILQEGKVDLVAIGRQLVADYHFLEKTKAGRFDEINRCIYCMYGCMNRDVFNGLEMTCTVNYLVGREDKLKEEDLIVAPARRKKVLVVGGGVAGLAVANTAARRGHEVVLAEREAELGGQARVADVPPGRESLGYLRADLIRALAQTDAVVLTSTPASPDLIKQVQPEAVVVAVGARNRVPQRLHPLVGNGVVVAFDDVLAGKATVGDRVVVYGGGEAAVRTADHLAFNLGKQVTMVTRQETVAPDFISHDRNPLMARLALKHVEMITGVQEVKTIEGRVVVFVDRDGAEHRLEADSIVLALQMEPDASRDQILKWVSQPTAPLVERYVIGDALNAGTFWAAYQDGVSLGLRI